MQDNRINILFLGDIVGKVGRKAVSQVLPEWKTEHAPDLVVANGENLSHGKGMTLSTYDEMTAAGVDVFTSGNHIWDKPEIEEIFSDENKKVIRPANYPDGTPGRGWISVPVNGMNVVIVNMMGVVNMPVHLDNPFIRMTTLLEEPEIASADMIFVDFHAEVTSEKVAFGWFMDGTVHAVVGTHTHVPTADDRILEKGTAYQSDTGMCGAWKSVLGVEISGVLDRFVRKMPVRHEYAESGIAAVYGTLLTLSKDMSEQRISRVFTKVET